MTDQFPIDLREAPAEKPAESVAPVLQFIAPAARQPAPPADSYGGVTVVPVDEVHLLDYVRVVYKHRWPAITAFLVGSLGALVYAFSVTPVYEARTQLVIEADAPNIVSFEEVLEQEKSTNDYYQTQYRILQSRSIARQTLDALNLWNHPQFAGPQPGASFGAGSLLGTLTGWTNGRFGREPVKERPEVDESAAQSNAVDTFLESLTVSPIRSSRLVDVKFRSSDAALSARVANGLVAAYTQQNLRYEFTASKDATDWLGQQLEEQRKKVDASEQALQRYREQNDSLGLDDRQNIVIQKLADLNAAVTKAKTERIQKESLYRQVQAIDQDRSAMDAVPAILASTFIQGLKTELAGLQRQEVQMAQRLGDKHPEMIRLRSAIETAEAKLGVEVGKIVSGVRNDYLAVLSQERSLIGVLEAQKGEAMSLSRKGIDYGVLMRDAESNRQIYESLLQRTKETGVSSELKASGIRVVDEAEAPQTPASPQRVLDLLIGLLGGAGFGIGLAFFFEYVDNRIKSPQDIMAHLGLPFLGMVPAISNKNGEAAAALISNGTLPAFSEAFRSIRTNVLFSSADEGMRSVLVTSSRPGEGKSLVASNLAVAIAQAGQRVLLVDADMRRPRMHEVFDVTLEPGLSNLLVGDATSGETIHGSAVENLWLLTAGKLPPNPAELLESKSFKLLLKGLGNHFEWVVIDSPPVMTVTDPSIAAHLVSGVVFVVGNEVTPRPAAQAAIRQLKTSRARLIGAVLNRVDIERNSYYYSDYYSKASAQYYRAAVST